MGDLGFGWYTSVVRGRLLTPVGTKTHLMIDWGLSMASLSGTSSGTLSNPEIGLVFSNEAGASTGFFSVVLPIAKEFGIMVDQRWTDTVGARWTPHDAGFRGSGIGEAPRWRR